jgi:hypothetical protein
MQDKNATYGMMRSAVGAICTHGSSMARTQVTCYLTTAYWVDRIRTSGKAFQTPSVSPLHYDPSTCPILMCYGYLSLSVFRKT